MPRLSLVLLSLSLGAVCAIVLAACGSDEEGTIPPSNAQALVQALQDARGEQSQQDCQGIADAAGNLLTQIDELPDTVDPEVRQALEEGATNLQNLGADETNCGDTGPTGEEKPETTDTTTTTPPPTTTETTTTDTTTEEETQPPKPKPPKPQPEPQPEQPGNEGGGLGQGDSGGTPPGLDNSGEGGGG